MDIKFSSIGLGGKHAVDGVASPLDDSYIQVAYCEICSGCSPIEDLISIHILDNPVCVNHQIVHEVCAETITEYWCACECSYEGGMEYGSERKDEEADQTSSS